MSPEAILRDPVKKTPPTPLAMDSVLTPAPRSVYLQDLTLAVEEALTRGAWDEARLLAATALDADPEDPGVLMTMGAMHEVAEQWQDALRFLVHAVARAPKASAAWQNIAMITARGIALQDPQLAALLAAVQAAHANPRAVQPAWAVAGIFQALGHHGTAHRWLTEAGRRLREHGDDAANRGPYHEFNRAFMHLTLGSIDPGHYPLGFAAYERRLEVSSHQLSDRARTRPPEGVPRLPPGVVPKSVAIFAEQGLGDTIMTARYAMHLAERGVRVVIEPQAPLTRLFRMRLQHENVRVLDFDAPLDQPVDAYVWSMSLPGLFWQRTIPTGEVIRSHWRRTKPYVAFCWQGSRSHRSDLVRSCAPAVFETIAAHVRALGLTPIALNYPEPTPAFLATPPVITDMEDTAQVLDQCVAVVSVDSALVHLAGAMGVPTVACLSAYPDWRWGLHDPPLPWYRSVRTARQPIIGDWDAVQAQAIAHLTQIVDHHTTEAVA
jgi:hypothetical protein